VDDLESIDALEEYIDASQVIMIFVSQGYFKSKNCLREARTAMQKVKPLALVFDPVRGGGTLKFIKEEECPVELKAIFEGRKIIEWHRIKDFQLVSLKLLAAELLFSCPGYEELYCASCPDNDSELSENKTLYENIYVPGEITEKQLSFSAKVRVYASPNNPGAREAVKVFQGAMSGLELSASPPPTATHFLLYLAESTFVGEAGERLAQEVHTMMRGDLPIVMLHENDPNNGGCEFSHFFSTTPQGLIADGLYKALALAYYPGHFRPVSLALVAKKLGAVSRRSWGSPLSARHVGATKVKGTSVELAQVSAASPTTIAREPTANCFRERAAAQIAAPLAPSEVMHTALTPSPYPR